MPAEGHHLWWAEMEPCNVQVNECWLMINVDYLAFYAHFHFEKWNPRLQIVPHIISCFNVNTSFRYDRIYFILYYDSELSILNLS